MSLLSLSSLKHLRANSKPQASPASVTPNSELKTPEPHPRDGLWSRGYWLVFPQSRLIREARHRCLSSDGPAGALAFVYLILPLPSRPNRIFPSIQSSLRCSKQWSIVELEMVHYQGEKRLH